MSDQKTYRRFTPSAWNIIKNVKFNDSNKDKNYSTRWSKSYVVCGGAWIVIISCCMIY
ncbi:hypothetical protein [Sulfurovum sp.]|uniref:hypothetical protein n=1 Tax=Sulfurovum sp. TaxID=1969726 RepID=UPI002867D299|nr:hypothetical protein [Sulfurovum sp.]